MYKFRIIFHTNDGLVAETVLANTRQAAYVIARKELLRRAPRITVQYATTSRLNWRGN